MAETTCCKATSTEAETVGWGLVIMQPGHALVGYTSDAGVSRPKCTEGREQGDSRLLYTFRAKGHVAWTGY